MNRLQYDGEENEFWENLSTLTVQSSEYILSKASNVVSVQNIDFPNFTNPKILEYFFSGRSSDKELRFKNCSFKKFDISNFNSTLNKLNFEDCDMEDEVILTKSTYKGLKILGCKFLKNSSLLLKGFKNNDNSRIFEIRNTIFNNSLFKVVNSNLNNTVFSNIKFINTPITFEDTNVNNLHLNKIVWGKNIVSDRDTFRELKFIMENQKNFIDSNYFHSLEMEEYRKELEKTNFFENFEDKILFNINYLISNFSQSWIFPTMYLFIFSIGFFSMGYIDGGREYMEYTLNDFFKFTNPLSKNTNEFDSIYSYWFIHKIISIVFIYHIVVSLKNKMRK